MSINRNNNTEAKMTRNEQRMAARKAKEARELQKWLDAHRTVNVTLVAIRENGCHSSTQIWQVKPGQEQEVAMAELTRWVTEPSLDPSPIAVAYYSSSEHQKLVALTLPEVS